MQPIMWKPEMLHMSNLLRMGRYHTNKSWNYITVGTILHFDMQYLAVLAFSQ